jgi:hypothetical protein
MGAATGRRSSRLPLIHDNLRARFVFDQYVVLAYSPFERSVALTPSST